MVNITYDTPPASAHGADPRSILAESIQWLSNLTMGGVYSPGDISWVLASTALVWLM
ncbi:hypothetical protein JB92DRAFT_2907265, partial [Gautieria morchelliformis]